MKDEKLEEIPDILYENNGIIFIGRWGNTDVTDDWNRWKNNFVKGLLTNYTNFLMKENLLDIDAHDECSIDKFLNPKLRK